MALLELWRGCSLLAQLVKCLNCLFADEVAELAAVDEVLEGHVLEVLLRAAGCAEGRDTDTRAVELSDDHGCNMAINGDEISCPEYWKRLSSKTHCAHHVGDVFVKLLLQVRKLWSIWLIESVVSDATN